MKYSTDKIINKLEKGEKIDYFFFWGHKKTKPISKSCLSQWYESKFTVNGVEFCSAEHWMMAEKALLFNDKESYKQIISTIDPKEIKALGRHVKYFNQRRWDEKKFEIVFNGNLQKFSQNNDLFNFIRSTKNKVLVEASPVDKIWGIGLAHNSPDILAPYFWKGKNLLGYGLMEVRDFLSQINEIKPLNNPMLPPWLAFPDFERYSLGWNMGHGEDYMGKFQQYYSKLNDYQRIIYKLTYPTRGEWKGWHEGKFEWDYL